MGEREDRFTSKTKIGLLIYWGGGGGGGGETNLARIHSRENRKQNHYNYTLVYLN